MRERKFIPLFALLFIAIYTGCVTRNENGVKTSSTQRLSVPNWGITIDATYDKKLDQVVPDYKILTVALTNRSVDMIRLEPNGDQWTIEDAWGRKQKAVVSLRIKDPRVWDLLPPKVKELVDYPAGVQMGYTQTFDLFFPQSVTLEGFRSIAFYSSTLKQNFDAVSSSSLERAVPAGNEGDDMVPDKFTPSPGVKKLNKTPPPAKPVQAPYKNQ